MITELINETIQKGSVSPNTRNRPGQIFEYDFGRAIGTNINGDMTSQLRVVRWPDGTIKTAFPF